MYRFDEWVQEELHLCFNGPPEILHQREHKTRRNHEPVVKKQKY
jgi:hypothetical protein